MMGRVNDLSASEAVILQIADADGVDPLALPPLHDAVDPDALDALFEPMPGEPIHSGTVSFTYNGYDVVVFRSNGEVCVALFDDTDVVPEGNQHSR